MKKILLRIVIVLVLLLILAVVGIGLSLNGIVKRAVETIGPKLTKVDVKLDSVSLSLLSGSGTLKGLVVGNPEGFTTPRAISMGSVTLALKPSSLLSDKVVINKLEVIAPDITIEVSLKGNNLSRILANVNESTGASGTNAVSPAARSPEEKAGKKLQVDDFLISGAKVTVAVTELGGKSQTVTISDIHFSELGTGPEGITAGELLQRVLPVIVEKAMQAASTTFPELSKAMGNLNQMAGGTLSNLTLSVHQVSASSLTNLQHSIGGATGGNMTNLNKGLNDLLKKK